MTVGASRCDIFESYVVFGLAFLCLTDPRTLAQRSVLGIAVGAMDISGRTWQDCCLEKFGPGNPKCWDVAADNDSAETNYHGCVTGWLLVKGCGFVK